MNVLGVREPEKYMNKPTIIIEEFDDMTTIYLDFDEEVVDTYSIYQDDMSQLAEVFSDLDYTVKYERIYE